MPPVDMQADGQDLLAHYREEVDKYIIKPLTWLGGLSIFGYALGASWYAGYSVVDKSLVEATVFGAFSFVKVVGGALALATASLCAGGLVGFIFGVPRTDGKLVVSATFFAPDKEEFLAIRATAAGQFDPDFGTGGIVKIDLAPPPDGVYSESSAAALQPDGRIILGGRAQLTQDFLVDLGVVRLLNAAAPNDTIFADGFDP